MGDRITGGLAQAGQWLARKFVRIWKFIARPSGSESPACAKPLVSSNLGGQLSENLNFETIKQIMINNEDKCP